jgi:hypothetical protein
MHLADTSSSFLQLHENCGKTNANEKAPMMFKLGGMSSIEACILQQQLGV